MKSSFTDRGNCINVDEEEGYVIIFEDDTSITHPEYIHLINRMQTTKENFWAFIQGVKAGEFDHFAKEPSTNPSAETLKRPVEWADFIGVTIVDPDGWRDGRGTPDIRFDQPTDWNDFVQRIRECTVKLREDFIGWDQIQRDDELTQ